MNRSALIAFAAFFTVGAFTAPCDGRAPCARLQRQFTLQGQRWPVEGRGLSSSIRARNLPGALAVRSPLPAASAIRATRLRAGQAPREHETEKKVTGYTLPPDLYRKARRLGQVSFWGNLAAPLYSWIVLLVILSRRLGPNCRKLSETTSSRKFLQAWVFAPPLLLTIDVLTIPFDIGEEWVSRKFGLSIESWRSWLWDWSKAEILFLIAGTFIIWILYAVIRRSPRRWWFYFWLVSLPIMVFLVFVQPVIVDPLFHKFVPLEQEDPALVASLEKMVHRAGQDIPPQRMFWMDAGTKTTELNAYVTGIGRSKRIVVWDTTIAKMDTPQIVYVAGHEMGHYVLNHIWKGMAAGAVGLFVLFYLGFRTIGWLLGRPGAKWEIRGVADWASLPALLLLVSVFSFIGTPIGSAVSRHFEHQADQYGLEVTHGLTPDSGEVAAQSFEILGEVDLSDPKPNPVDVFLFYSHPPIPNRIRFALTYDPWAHGQPPEWVK
jgi:STE24 endopeptidase